MRSCPCFVGDSPKRWFQQGVVFIKDMPFPNDAGCTYMVLESNHTATAPIKSARKVSMQQILVGFTISTVNQRLFYLENTCMYIPAHEHIYGYIEEI